MKNTTLITDKERSSWIEAYEKEHKQYRPFKTISSKRMFDAGLKIEHYTQDREFIYKIINREKYMLAKLKYGI
jgi:hypothetical protein